MHILEVIIDGFKSYATRTVVSGFDPEFNAITGLNGSGKSNILDSICFVLGISNLSQVRAANLQELVYKQGQAGVTKASVTVVFDNSDMKKSPVGYEGEKKLCVTREVVIGGRNRYLVNGRAAQASAVANLFQSVQLNVNNPHFLIMQGRITKVLNMKPPEILSMVEEAAGTRMFESKKQAALKTLEKKQAKVVEIDKVLAEDITPTLERLREEKSHYLRWSANAAEVARLERFCVAAEYSEASAAQARCGTEADEAERTAAALEDEAAAKRKEAEALAAEEAASRGAGGAAGRAAEKRKALREAVDAAARECARLEAARRGAADAAAGDEAAVAGEATAAAEAAGVEAAKAAELEKREADVAAREADLAAAAEGRDEAERLHREACAGQGEGATKSVGEQLSGAKAAAREAAATAQRCGKKAAALEKRRDGAAEAAKKHDREAAQLRAAATKAGEKASKAEAKVAAHAARAPADLDGAADGAKAARLAAREADAAVARCEAQLKARLRFDYEDPGKGFDAKKVRGVLASLVEPAGADYAAALEVVAGGRLYQVVVDDEKTGKALLDKGKLTRRVTLVPLNKIRAPKLDGKRVDRAAAVAAGLGGGAFASVALEFVGYAPAVAKAVEYAFGGAFVCDSMATARAVAFDRDVRVRCVTLDGDVCDPRGTLSGGSANAGLGALLAKLVELSGAKEAAAAAAAAAGDAERAADAAEAHAAEAASLGSEAAVAGAARDAAREQLSASAGGAALESLEAIDAEIAALRTEAADAAAAAEEAKRTVKTIEKDGASREKARAAELKRLEADAKRAKKAHDGAAKAKAEAEKRLKTARAELHALGAEKRDGEASAKDLERALAASRKALAKADAALGDAAAARDAAQADLDAASADLDAAEAGAKDLAARAAAAKKRAVACDVEAKKLAHGAGRSRADFAKAEKRVGQLVAHHAWIPAEAAFFGRPGGDYDFSTRDARKARDELDELTTSQDDLAKKINKRVMGMIEKAEREYDDLNTKKGTVARDKAKIEAVIGELDVKKQETLEATWRKVNHDFGSIFSSLLPGASAKLEPPAGLTVLDGLEVKVAFGNLWKDSLSELSGGQRSLIALSLVLSMLLFKPAPMYILDEVDAALDLSHTQNIGNMLRAHFKASQFIVVSLKEGMFNNANVIFRTKFVDGVSTVARTVTKHGDRNPAAKRKKV